MRKIAISTAALVCAFCCVTTAFASEPEFNGNVNPQGGLTPGFGAVQQTTFEAFQRDYPHAGIYRTSGRITRVYAGPLSQGPDALQSADSLINSYINMFGVGAEDLRPHSFLRDQQVSQPVMYDKDSGTYKFMLVYYSQYQDDIPVYMCDIRVLVRNETDFPAVLVSANLRGLKDYSVPQALRNNINNPAYVTAQFELAKQQVLSETDTLVNFSQPEVYVWAGVGDEVEPPVVVLRFVADDQAPGGSLGEKWVYFCDIETGEIIRQEQGLLDVDGNTSGLVTQGIGSDNCEPEASEPVPYLNVTSGGNSTFSDVNGNFTIADGGDITATLADGQYWDLNDFVTTVESVTAPASTPANLIFNAFNATELIRAQVNTVVGANLVRDFTATYNPSYPTFTDVNIPCWSNRTDGFCPGNAWYDPSDFGSPTGYSINFCQSGGSNPNTSWSSVIYHEFGHHLVAAAGSGQGQYGEGTGDCMSAIILDDPHIGFGFFGTCDDAGTLRSADNNLQYPCSGAIHFCGQLIAGCVWDTRNQLVITEPLNYIDILGNLEVNSILLHTGSDITPQITIDWLTLDDDDANIGNGTPHYPEICAGFGVHNMDCPVLQVGLSVIPATDLIAGGDVGGPFTPDSQVYTLENLGPGSIDYSVTTAEPWITITGGAGTLPVIGNTAQVTVSINSNADALPMGVYNGTVSFTNTTDGVGDTVRFVNLSIGIPDNCSSALVVCPGTYSDSTVTMTNDGSASCGTTDSTPDIWYSYTPDSNTTATFSLCTGTSYDAALSVHTGCPGTSGNEVGCDDDGCGTTGGPATVTTAVTAGQTYLIRVTGWNGSTGSFTLDITGPDCASTALSISYPGGRPSSMVPGVANVFDVEIADAAEQYVLGTATLHYRYDGGTYLTTLLTPLGGNTFQASLTPPDCNAVPEYYISADGNLGTTVNSPSTAPATVYSATVATSSNVVVDDFETDNGWTVSGSPADGQWTRGIPVICNRGDPPADSDGSGQCWLTDNSAANSCNSDVDGGTTILTSPAYDMSSGGTITYDYWLDDGTGSFIDDSLTVEVANDAAGTNWMLLRTYATPVPSWQTDTITVGSAGDVTASSTIRLRFSASDLGSASLIECAIDNLVRDTSECNLVPCPAADGDMDDGGTTDATDIQLFVDAVLGSPTPDEICAGDFNGNSGLDDGDVVGFVGALLTP